MGPARQGQPQECGWEEGGPGSPPCLVSPRDPAHVPGSYFLGGLGQPVAAAPLSRNKAAFPSPAGAVSLLQVPGLGPGPPSATHKTFFSGDGSHVALHSSTSSWCFSVFQPASCSPFKNFGNSLSNTWCVSLMTTQLSFSGPARTWCLSSSSSAGSGPSSCRAPSTSPCVAALRMVSGPAMWLRTTWTWFCG